MILKTGGHLFFFCACVVLAVSGVARAADLTLTVSNQASVIAESDWAYVITSYSWAAGIKGDTALFGTDPVSVDVKFFDLFDAIVWSDFSTVGMINGEVWNHRFGVFAGLVHLAPEIDEQRQGLISI